MPTWLEVTLHTTGTQLEALSQRLTDNGAQGLVLEDETDFKRFLEQNRQYWDYVDDALLERMKGAARIKFYVPQGEDGLRQMSAILRGVDAPVSTAPVKEEDWAYSWQKYYHPMAVGDRLYIVPEWERGHSVPEGRVPVYLNPGLAFGTGAHASTRMCLCLLEKRVRPGTRVLDLGCGSGILSIAALCLGAENAAGVDIDPKAADIARENAALNGIGSGRLRVGAGDVLSDRQLVQELAGAGGYELVLANIVADVIIPLAGTVPRLLAPGGWFLCSGILDERCGEVERALAQAGLELEESLVQDGWRALAARGSAP